jgi:hypothetical protein
MQTRKKPCSVCRRWFMPEARVGRRQRTCGRPECRQEQRKRTQAGWRASNPDYWTDRRLHRQMQQAESEGKVRIHSPPAPTAVQEIPWQHAQDAMGLKAAVFLAFLVRLSLRLSSQALRAHSANARPVGAARQPEPAEASRAAARPP